MTDSPKHKRSFGAFMRDSAETLIYAFVLAMMIRTFVAEPYVIPSGSMTPTLIGNLCAYYDIDGDGDDDLLTRNSMAVMVFYRENGKFTGKSDFVRHRPSETIRFTEVRDKIIVTKFNYWFSTPERGDIIIFKVPKVEGHEWDARKPIYIKRVVGLPGEVITIEDEDLLVDGRTPETPPIDSIAYANKYGFTSRRVPEGALFVFGDNSKNSLDSRAWGKMPLENVRGKALLRFLPLNRIGFLH